MPDFALRNSHIRVHRLWKVRVPCPAPLLLVRIAERPVREPRRRRSGVRTETLIAFFVTLVVFALAPLFWSAS